MKHCYTCFYFYRWGENYFSYCEFYKKLIKDIPPDIRNKCQYYKEKVKI
jgi:hypothetical protein